MNAVVRVLLVVPLAGALLAGCAGPSRLRARAPSSIRRRPGRAGWSKSRGSC